MLIYLYDEVTKRYMYSVSEYPDNYDLPENATTVEPVDSNGAGLYNPTWNESTGSWDSLTEAEWKEKYIIPEEKSGPTESEQLQAQQVVMIANLTKQVQDLQGAVKTLVLQNAVANKEEK